MKSIRFASLAFFAAAAFAQQWEIGGTVGGSIVPGVSVTAPSGTATAGFQSGLTAGVFVGQNLYPHISGEVRYNFLQSNLKLTSGGTTADFSGTAHAVYYDVLIHSNRGSETRSQIYAAVGGGMKIFRGSGTESAYQPLSQFGYFTKTQTVKPMLSVGGGWKFRLSPHMNLRMEVRDFVTPFPKAVLTPAPGASFGALLHDIVPLVGISYQY